MDYSINKELTIYKKENILLYLEDIQEYVNSILLYHNGYNNLELEEILMYLSSVDELIQNIKDYIINKS